MGRKQKMEIINGQEFSSETPIVAEESVQSPEQEISDKEMKAERPLTQAEKIAKATAALKDGKILTQKEFEKAVATGKTPDEILQNTLQNFKENETADEIMQKKMKLVLETEQFIKENRKNLSTTSLLQMNILLARYPMETYDPEFIKNYPTTVVLLDKLLTIRLMDENLFLLAMLRKASDMEKEVK